MPKVIQCEEDGKPGFKYEGDSRCYTYKKGDTEAMERARRKAEQQGKSIRANEKLNRNK